LDRQEVMDFYQPLARCVLERRQPGQREIVAVAGPPGSGKSAFAAVLTAVLDALAGEKLAALVGLDGWHFPNAYLDSHTIRRVPQSSPPARGLPGGSSRGAGSAASAPRSSCQAR
jgi:pantothenate kinase